MKTIFKYPLSTTDEQVIDMPADAEILCVQVQRDVPCVWARVTDGPCCKPVKILVFGTGHPIEQNPGRYVGTYQLHGGAVVFHVYEATV